jgi:hypothetical protein
MKTLFLLSMVAFMAISCSKENDASVQALEFETDSHSFVFGKALGRCNLADCAEFYKIENSQLFPDIVKYYNGEGTVQFSKAALSNDKYLIAKELEETFPEYMRARPNQVFGCPNCYDQGSYQVEITDNGVTTYYHIDTNLEALPVEIRPWVQRLESVLNMLP